MTPCTAVSAPQFARNACAALCLHHLLTSPSSSAEMRMHRQSGCRDPCCGGQGGNLQGRRRWLSEGMDRHRLTFRDHLNKTGGAQQQKKLINGFTTRSNTVLIYKVTIATGFSSPTVHLQTLFNYFHLTFNMLCFSTKHITNSPSLSLIFQMDACFFTGPK